MRVYELVNAGKFPKNFGNAEVKLTNQEEPGREGSLIKLPNQAEAEIFLLVAGNQFIYRTSSYNNGQIWFGGQDEQPFLVRLDSAIFATFVQGGERGFFAALKPKTTTQAEKVLEAKTVRQGDMHFTPLPYSWKELSRAAFLYGGSELRVMQAKDQPLFHTRHHVSGRILEGAPLIGSKHTVVDGEVIAPDHEALTFDVPHLVIQTQYLWDPKNAD